MGQTTVQKSGAIKLGSALMEVGDSIGSLQNLGAMRGIAVTETFDKIEVESDNAGVIKEYIKNQRVGITGSLIEIDLEMLDEIRGGIDTYAPIAAAPADPTTDEKVILPDTDLVRLLHKMGDGTEVTAIVVTDQQATPVTFVLNTDYVVGVDSAGYTCLARIVGGDSDDNEEGLVDYQYTPNASKKLTSGGKKTILPKVVRLTNKDQNSKMFRITIYFASIEEGITFEFPSDEAEDVMVAPINLVGKVDVDRTIGDQLYEIIDEQSIV